MTDGLGIDSPLGIARSETVGTTKTARAKAAPCVLRFQIVAEGGADLGCMSAALLAPAMTARGLPPSAVIGTSAAGALASLWVLRRYYLRIGHEAPQLAQ